jgi:hypothetical protein
MAGRLLGLLINLVVFPAMAASVGYVFFDKIPGYVNALAHFPMDGVNTLILLKYIFTAGIFVFVCSISWNHIAQSQNEQDEVV